METEERKQPRPRRWFTPAFKADIVERCRRGDRSVGQVTKHFDRTETAARESVKQAEVDAGERAGLTSAERDQLAQLRRENRRQREDVDILERATVFFVDLIVVVGATVHLGLAAAQLNRFRARGAQAD